MADLTSQTNALGLTAPQSPLSGSSPIQSIPVQLQVPPSSVLSRKIQGFSSSTLDNWNIDVNSHPYYFRIIGSSGGRAFRSDGIGLSSNILNAAGLNTDTFVFYIPPAAISIQNIFAINVAATNNGILEEHNGMVFRNIQISGTTGLWPNKPNRQTNGLSGLLGTISRAAQSLFPTTTSAIAGVASKIGGVANAILGGKDGDIDVSNKKLLSVDEISRTGWFQFWQLNNFLIAYSEFKKKPSSVTSSGSGSILSVTSNVQNISPSDIRLVFGSQKDNIGYVVTPVSFTLKRDITNPLLYRYEITLKAWDITTSNPSITVVPADIPSPDAQSIISALTGVLTSARQVIQAATNVLQGVTSDILSVYNIYNQALLLYQDTAGLISDVRTFFPTFVAQRQSLLLNSSRNQTAITSAANDPSARPGNMPDVSSSVAVQINKSQTLDATTAATLGSLGVNTSVPVSTTPGGEQITDPTKQSISPQADTLVLTALGTDTFKNLTIDQLDIPASIQSGIDSTRQNSQNLTAADVMNLTTSLQQISDNYAISLGSMDPNYAATYGLTMSNTAIQRMPTANDIITAAALQDSKIAFLSTLATGQFFLERDADPFLAANQSLQSPDLLNTPNSSIAVPFQRGATLDTLAQQYLGDAKRSREIEVLNNLRAPYIDEVGFTLPILGPNGRTFVVTSIADLIIGQEITISSNSAVTSNRMIINIENIGNSEWQITVDGLPNLSMYTPSSSPQLFAYLPGTVGPGDTILIPSGVVPDQFAAIRPTPLYNTLSSAEKVFLVDIALDAKTGQDISVSANGDVGLSYGYNNATQALRLAVEIEQNELDRHPTYGLSTPVGSRNSDFTTQEIETAIQNSILNDPRFLDADCIVNVNGSVVNVDISAQGASGTGQIPVSFEIGRAG